MRTASDGQQGPRQKHAGSSGETAAHPIELALEAPQRLAELRRQHLSLPVRERHGRANVCTHAPEILVQTLLVLPGDHRQEVGSTTPGYGGEKVGRELREVRPLRDLR